MREHFKSLAEIVTKNEAKRKRIPKDLVEPAAALKEGLNFISKLLVSRDPNVVKVREAICDVLSAKKGSRANLYRVEVGHRRTLAIEINLVLANKGAKDERLEALVVFDGYRQRAEPKVDTYPHKYLAGQKEISRKMLENLTLDIEKTFSNQEPGAQEQKLRFVEGIARAFSPLSIKKALGEILSD